MESADNKEVHARDIRNGIPGNDPVLRRLCRMYQELLMHDGFAEMHIDIKILKRGQKEVIIQSGKQYRYVVDVPGKLVHWE
ncbi:MAG: hypothetical protein LBQ54_11520 [Planctomycetaceae bacterium]|jgi:hypothetical protein|nr:hypothetical protein [Planctomycetaceae bacterium]